MYTYQISLRNHLKHLWVTFFYLPILLIGGFVISFDRYGYLNWPVLSIVVPATLLVFVIPQGIVHLNYFFRNRQVILFYDPTRYLITINKSGISRSFHFSDIELIERYKSFPLAEDRLQWFPWDVYNHSIIHLKDGSKFVVTSLLVPNMDLPIDSNKVVLKKSFYRLAKKVN